MPFPLEHKFYTINVGTTSQNGRKESSSVKQAACSGLLNHEDRRLPSVDGIGYHHHIMHSWFVQFDQINSVPYKLTSVSRGQKRSRLGEARRYTACSHAQNHTKHTSIPSSVRLRQSVTPQRVSRWAILPAVTLSVAGLYRPLRRYQLLVYIARCDIISRWAISPAATLSVEGQYCPLQHHQVTLSLAHTMVSLPW